ncbi:MAG TPA: hypothetical protein V6D28_13765 [Leptolyngbyaceae cyanobacterium]
MARSLDGSYYIYFPDLTRSGNVSFLSIRYDDFLYKLCAKCGLPTG